MSPDVSFSDGIIFPDITANFINVFDLTQTVREAMSECLFENKLECKRTGAIKLPQKIRRG